MTAAHENLFAFNPGQDETTQKGRGGKQVHTLASYLMGCDDGSFARLDDTDGYVAGYFTQPRGTQRSVYRRHGHARPCGKIRPGETGKIRRCVFPRCARRRTLLGHFIREAGAERHLTPITKIQAEFKNSPQ